MIGIDRRLKAAIIACTVPLAFWVGGFDFNTRGWAATMCFLLSAFVYITMLFLSLKEDK